MLRTACATGTDEVGVSVSVGVAVIGCGVLVGIRVGTFAPSVADGTIITTIGVGLPLHAAINNVNIQMRLKWRRRRLTAHLP